jgi:hypothetical protein
VRKTDESLDVCSDGSCAASPRALPLVFSNSFMLQHYPVEDGRFCGADGDLWQFPAAGSEALGRQSRSCHSISASCAAPT